MLSETPASIKTCLGPPGVFTRSMISGGNSECIWRGSLSSLIFQSNFMFLTFAVVRIFSSFCHAVRWELPPSVSHSALQARALDKTNVLNKTKVRIAVAWWGGLSGRAGLQPGPRRRDNISNRGPVVKVRVFRQRDMI